MRPDTLDENFKFSQGLWIKLTYPYQPLLMDFIRVDRERLSKHEGSFPIPPKRHSTKVQKSYNNPYFGKVYADYAWFGLIYPKLTHRYY